MESQARLACLESIETSCTCCSGAGENTAEEELDLFSLLRSRRGVGGVCEVIKDHDFVQTSLGLRRHLA